MKKIITMAVMRDHLEGATDEDEAVYRLVEKMMLNDLPEVNTDMSLDTFKDNE